MAGSVDEDDQDQDAGDEELPPLPGGGGEKRLVAEPQELILNKGPRPGSGVHLEVVAARRLQRAFVLE